MSKSTEMKLGLAVLGASPLFQGEPLERPVIAAACGCSPEAIRQIEERGLRKIRRAIGAEGMELLTHIFMCDRQTAKPNGAIKV